MPSFDIEIGLFRDRFGFDFLERQFVAVFKKPFVAWFKKTGMPAHSAEELFFNYARSIPRQRIVALIQRCRERGLSPAFVRIACLTVPQKKLEIRYTALNCERSELPISKGTVFSVLKRRKNLKDNAFYN